MLLKLADDYGRSIGTGVRIDFKLSQRDLSNLVAATRESVNKQLRAWRDSNVVDIDAGYIILLQPTRLERLVERDERMG